MELYEWQKIHHCSPVHLDMSHLTCNKDALAFDEEQVSEEKRQNKKDLLIFVFIFIIHLIIF